MVGACHYFSMGSSGTVFSGKVSGTGRWTLFAGVYGIYFSFGVVAGSIPPLVGDIRADLDISRVAMGLALGAWQLVYIGAAPPAGRLVDRFGVRWAILTGGLIILLSGFLRALAVDSWTLWGAMALMGLGGPLVSVGTPRAVALWFEDPRERRIAVGTYTTAPALGGIFTLVFSNSFLMPLTGSWRLTVILQSGLMVAALIIWLLLTGRTNAPMVSSEVNVSAESREWLSLLQDRQMRMVFALGLGVFFIIHGLSGWMPDLLHTHSGFSSMAAAKWAAVGTSVGVLAALILPGRAEGRRLSALLVGLLVLVAASLLVVLVSPTFVDPIPVALAGARGSLVPLVVVILMESKTVGPHNMGSAYGFWFAVAQLGGVTGPLVVGRVADSDYGFGGALVGMAFVCLLVALLASRLSASERASLDWDEGIAEKSHRESN